MKTALAFGDSITHGVRPDADARHAFEDRWPNVLAAGLQGVHVIEEGLGGRCSAFDGPTAGFERNGARVLPTLLQSHAPLDLVIILLGSNDIWLAEVSPRLAAVGTQQLIGLIRSHDYRYGAGVPEILIVSPPRACQSAAGDVAPDVIAGIAELPAAQKAVAEAHGCGWFDASTVAKPMENADGAHLDAQNTRAIGQALIPIVADLL